MASYEYLDHTADVAIRARGETVSAALGAMIEGVIARVTEGGAVAPREERRIAATGELEDEAIVGFFNELLYVIEGEGWLPCAVKQVAHAAGRVEAVLAGEPYDPARHALGCGIKAATYHGFSLREAGGAWELVMVFDV